MQSTRAAHNRSSAAVEVPVPGTGSPVGFVSLPGEEKSVTNEQVG